MDYPRFRFTLAEVSGSLADIGVMIPLVILLIVKNGMNPTAVLAGAGLLYIISGLLFRLPVPVQPLKAVSIIAIASGLPPGVIAAAGILMGVILLFLAGTGTANLLGRLFTRPIVRGIQLGVGVLLVTNGLKMVMDPQFLRGGEKIFLQAFGSEIPAGLLFGIAGGALLLIFSASRRVPAALALLVFGLASGFFFGSYEAFGRLTIAPVLPELALPSLNDFTRAFFLLVLPQIPLTFGNSIVATADTARRYFGPRGDLVTPVRLSLSLGIANILAGITGAAPLCHGAGGMTAHYRFGARTGGMGLIIGSALLAAGLLFGSSATELFVLLPGSILGVMLIFIGIEHGMLIRDMVDSREDLFVTLAIGTIAGATGNIFAATLTGFMVLLVTRLKNGHAVCLVKH